MLIGRHRQTGSPAAYSGRGERCAGPHSVGARHRGASVGFHPSLELPARPERDDTSDADRDSFTKDSSAAATDQDRRGVAGRDQRILPG